MFIKSKDIAEILGISRSTVSLAINNKPGVSTETKNKVIAVLEDFYSSGRFVAKDEKNITDIKGSIVLVIHKAQKQLFLPNSFFQNVIDGIQSVSMHNNYMLEINYFNTGMNNKILIDSLSDSRVSGVIVYATELPYSEIQLYRELGKPVVILDARFPVQDMDMVTLANNNAVACAVEYAYKLGHRRIGFLKSRTRINNFDDRYEGYVEGLKTVGLEFNEKYVFTTTCSIEGAAADFLKILETPVDELPTIFLTDLDYNVAGALRAIKKRKYKVPDDFSLIGFDDLELTSELDPPLTTIRIKHRFGAIAMERLIKKIENDDGLYLNIEVATELVVRDSVKCIN